MKARWITKISVLAVSLIVGSAAATSSITPLLLERFGTQWRFAIEMIPTMPSFFIILAILLSGRVASRIGTKKTMMLGLALAFLAGLAPVIFSGSLFLLLVFKALFGFGYGLFNANVFTLINSLYSGQERVQMIGLNSAFQGAGGSLLTLSAGLLLVFGWNYSFLVYLLILPVLLLFAFAIPEIPQENKQASESIHFSAKVVLYILLMFISCICWNTAVVKLSLHVVSNGLGTASDSSLAFTLQQIAYMITGLFFSKILGFMKRKLLPLALVLMSLSAVTIALTTHMIGAVMGCILAGISSGFLFSYLYTNLPNHARGKTQSLATSGMVISGHLAGFISPFVLNWFGKPGILASTHAQAFLTSSIVLLSLALITYIVQNFGRRFTRSSKPALIS